MSDPTANPFSGLQHRSPTLANQPESAYRPAAQAEVALEQLFLYLRQKGFPLTIRDYQDALQALLLGYGLPTRADLLWLCQTLWARSDEEERLLNLLFQDFPQPTPAEVSEITGQPVPTAPPPLRQGRPPSERVQSQQKTRPDQEALPIPGMQFVGPGQSGLGLPPAQIKPDPGELFILTEHPLIPLRNLIIIWRRFRRPVRTGPQVELDIEATIAARCRQGLLEAPVLIPARRNLARMTLLIEVGERMAPWQRFNPLLVESLQYSQLGQATVYYTDALGDDMLYQRENFSQPVPLAYVLNQAASSLLILSEAGATQDQSNPALVRRVKAFLQQVGQVWSPVAWVNPMPATRWPGTAAASIAQLPQVSMFELNEEGLINAVDVLRGK